VLHDRHCPVPSLSSGWWPLSRGTKPSGLDIWRGVDCPSTCEIESYMEKLVFIWACLSDVRVIMVIMHVPLIQSLCQAVMGWIPTRVPIARHAWGMWPCPVTPGSKCNHFPRLWCTVKSTLYWNLLDGATRCPSPSRVEEGGTSGRQVEKSYLPTSTVMRKRDAVDCSRVQVILGWWLSSSTKSGEAISGMRCMATQPFAARGN
jgi:hypothetical protein